MRRFSLHDVHRYRELSIECSQIASNTKDAFCRQQLEQAAAGYSQLARGAAALVQTQATLERLSSTFVGRGAI